MADTRRILSQLGHEPTKASQVNNDTIEKNKLVTTAGSVADLPTKKLTFEALSKLCMLPTEENQLSPDQI